MNVTDSINHNDTRHHDRALEDGGSICGSKNSKILQLSAAGLLGLLILQIRHHGLLIDPTKRTKSLRQYRMREMVASIHPISIHGAQILYLKLDQGAGQLCRVTQLQGEFVGLELVFSAQNIHEQFNDCIHRRQGVREQDEADNDREFIVEAKGLVERFVVYEDGEQGEDVEEMGLKAVN